MVEAGSGRRTRTRRRRPETTVLYQVVARELQTFLARVEHGDCPGLPAFVRRELAALLDCGILARGFARVRCKGCGDDLLVAFSCKGRGICPSCGGRRMADTAAHLVDRVLPRVPVRQWVSLPFIAPTSAIPKTRGHDHAFEGLASPHNAPT